RKAGAVEWQECLSVYNASTARTPFSLPGFRSSDTNSERRAGSMSVHSPLAQRTRADRLPWRSTVGTDVTGTTPVGRRSLPPRSEGRRRRVAGVPLGLQCLHSPHSLLVTGVPIFRHELGKKGGIDVRPLAAGPADPCRPLTVAEHSRHRRHRDDAGGKKVAPH